MYPGGGGGDIEYMEVFRRMVSILVRPEVQQHNMYISVQLWCNVSVTLSLFTQ